MKFWCKVITLCLSVFIFSFNAVASQAQATVRNLSLDHLSVADGLSQGSVYALMQDREGHIWLGTEAGINIYDGYEVRQLSGPDGDFSQYTVDNLLQDSSGIIWMNLYEKGLYTYNPIKGEYKLILQPNPDNNDDYIVDIIEESPNSFIIATAKSVGRYIREKDKYETILDLSTELVKINNIRQILLSNDILYIATRVGVYALNTVDNRWKKIPNIKESKDFSVEDAAKSYNLHITQNQTLYIGTFVAVFELDVSNIKEFISGALSLPARKVAVDKISSWSFVQHENKLYIGNDRGLSVLNMDTGHSKHLFGLSDSDKYLGGDKIVSVLVDNTEQIWLGSSATGAYRWNPNAEIFNNIKYKKDSPNSLSYNEVWHIKPNKEEKSKAWVATANGLNLVDIKTGAVQQYLVNPDSGNFYSKSHIYLIREDRNNRLWLSTAKGVVLFDIESKQEIELPFSDEINQLLVGEDVYDIYLDRDDTLWLITKDGIRNLSLSTGELDLLPELNKVIHKDSLVYTLGYLPDSDIMTIGAVGVFWGYNPKTREANAIYQLPEVLDSQLIMTSSWAIDKNNIFWLNFAGKGVVGLTLPDFEQKYYFHKGNVSIDENVYGVMADKEGDIWFSSHNGLYLIDADSLHIRNFTMEDGLPAMEFNDGAFSHELDGYFAYGSMSGVSFFDPIVAKRSKAQHKLDIYITHIDVLSRHLKLPMVVTEETPLAFNYDDIGIRFSFSTLTYGNQELIEFEYLLTGKKEVRYPTTVNNEISFSSLPSGKYQLQVRAKSPTTGQYSPAKTLTFTVSYAPWASPLAYFIYAIAFIFIIAYWLTKKSMQTQALKNAHEQVIFRENRLQLALAGSNSEVWDWQADDGRIFANRMAKELGYKEFGSSYCFSDHIALIHPNDKATFLSHWKSYIEFANQQENFSCTYRMKTADGNWLWYRDLGKAVTFKEGKPSRITGSYTNITESRAAEQRAQYYGDAFKQTNDWVLIISENFANMTANQSLRDVFGWQDEELRFDSSLLGLSRERRNYYRRVLLSLKEGEHWRGEDLILTKEGTEYHVIININVCRNNTNNSLYYVCVFTDITAQKVAENELRYLANYDHLTELPNRSLLLDRIKHAMDFAKRKSSSLALFFIDLDKFKQVNDSLGHDYGDLLLQEISKRLTEVLRVDDTVARMGGDEFVVLLESYRSNSQLAQIAQKVIRTVEQPFFLKQTQVSVGASIGIALYPEDAKDSGELLRNADVAMYHAKQIGRNTFQFFTQRMNYEASLRLEKESLIKLAHKNQEFINYYQPIVDAAKNRVIGVELLMRWQTDDGIKSPAEFIALAEELNLISEMTEQAIVRGLNDLQHWRTYDENFYLSVNISAQQFITSSLVDIIRQQLREFDIPARCLKLEVTESTLINEPNKAINTMQQLNKLGIELALDDFGTGYSSLSYLKQLPLSILKIDRSFVSGIGVENMDEAIVDTTLVLANKLGIKCIAEGVETPEQVNYLLDKQCHFIQGFLYSKPLPLSEVNEFIVESCQSISSSV